MKISYKTAFYALFLLAFVDGPAWAQSTADIDFSCMKTQVRPIIRVTDQHQEFDLVVRNQCPGAVNWAMCVERLDPWTFSVVETHTPVGRVEQDKRSRVNLQMKATPSPDAYESRSQAFYLSMAYTIQGQPEAECVARSCEARKKELRSEQLRNSNAWRQARKLLEERAVEECPEHGWNSDDVQACRQDVIDAASEQMTAFAASDEDLRAQLAAIDPDKCAVYGGEILELPKS